MDQTLLPQNNQDGNKGEDKSSVGVFPSSAVSIASSNGPFTTPSVQPVSQNPSRDNISGSLNNINMAYNDHQFKLASTEVQGPKPPLVGGGNLKFVLVVIILILVTIAGIGGYYFYIKGTNFLPVISPIAVIPAETSIIDKNLDTDGDGLPDVIEKVIGTDIDKVDTDFDKFSDFQEIKNGYSPLISDAVGKYAQEEWNLVKEKIKIENEDFYKREFGVSALLSPNPSPSVTPEATLTPLSFNCGMDTVSGIDNNIYKTVKNGEQC